MLRFFFMFRRQCYRLTGATIRCSAKKIRSLQSVRVELKFEHFAYSHAFVLRALAVLPYCNGRNVVIRRNGAFYRLRTDLPPAKRIPS